MSFNLYVIRKGGSEYKTLRSPYPDRESTASTVRTIIASRQGGTDDREFAEQVAAHPVGETITHTVSGLGFRTEEV